MEHWVLKILLMNRTVFLFPAAGKKIFNWKLKMGCESAHFFLTVNDLLSKFLVVY